METQDNGRAVMVFADPIGAPMGDTGLSGGYSGYANDFTTLRRLRGEEWIRTVAEMQLSPVIKGMLFAVEMLIRRAEWHVTPASGTGISTAKAEKAAEFVDSCRSDMYTGWEDTLAMVLSFLPYGYSVFEQLYKRRLGPDGDAPSAHDDGLIGWDDWSPRPQDSIAGWIFDRAGRPTALKQRKKGLYGSTVEIPLTRCLHFRAGGYRGSPEGESALRSAYIDWDAIQKLQITEAIGIERDLAGLPVALVPPRYLQANRSVADDAFFKQIRKIITGIRNNEQAGVVFPMEYDANGRLLYEIKLMSSGGGRQFDTSAVIARRTSQMTMAMLADFLTLGHGSTGSWALSRDKTELFEVAISAWLDMIANVIVEQGFKALLRLNAIDLRLTPGLVGTPPDSEDLSRIGSYVTELMPMITAASVEREDLVDVLNHLFELGDLPELTATVGAIEEEKKNPTPAPVPVITPFPEEPNPNAPVPAEVVAPAPTA